MAISGVWLTQAERDAFLRRFPPLYELSRRELEVAVLVAGGLTNQQIAEQLFISNNTVKRHLERIFRRLGMRNRLQLAVAVYRAARLSERYELDQQEAMAA